MAISLRLMVFRGEELLAVRSFERDLIKIGRLRTADLSLEDEKASRIHSVLSVGGNGRLSIVDLSSVEGTYLNGKRVDKGFVELGDEIRIGDTRILVVGGGEEGEASARDSRPLAMPGPMAAVETPPAPERTKIQGPERAPAPAVARPESRPAPAAEAPQAAEACKSPAPAPPVMSPVSAAPQSAVFAVPIGGRHRTLLLHQKSFGSFVQRAPFARRPSESTGDLGLQVRFLWGDQTLQVWQRAKPEGLYVGSTSRCALRIAGDRLPVSDHALLTASGGGWMLNLAEGMHGGLDRDGRHKAIGAGAYELCPVDFAWVDLGGIRAEFSFTAQPKRVAAPLSESLDYRFLNLLVSLLSLGAVFAIAAATHTEADVLADDLKTHRIAVAKFLITEVNAPHRNALNARLSDAKDPAPAKAAERPKGREGKMGKRDAPTVIQDRAALRISDIDAKQLVMTSSLLDMLGSRAGRGLSAILGQRSLGGELKGAAGSIFGSRVGGSGGFGGLAPKGTGSAGGGMQSTIGIGAIGTRRRAGNAPDYGAKVGSLEPKEETDPVIGDATGPTVVGSLDKEAIRRVIRAHLGQIRYCYEGELRAKPDLAGKISVRFIIDPAGDVARAQVSEDSTLDEPRLSECIQSRVRGWKFPTLKGGGNVVVTYPFVFRPLGE